MPAARHVHARAARDCPPDGAPRIDVVTAFGREAGPLLAQTRAASVRHGVGIVDAALVACGPDERKRAALTPALPSAQCPGRAGPGTGAVGHSEATRACCRPVQPSRVSSHNQPGRLSVASNVDSVTRPATKAASPPMRAAST